MAYLNRAGAYKHMGDTQSAENDLDRMVELIGKNPAKMNNVAWILVSNHDRSIRDGKYAIKLATQACELTGWKQPQMIDTLAGAYAQNGQFDKAVEWQEKAVALAPKKHREDFAKHLEKYRQGRPYRD